VSWDGWVRFVNIALVDLALSGDNAIVIGMAAAALPGRQRRWAILVGGAAAIVLRVLLTTVATYLLLIPYLTAAGGAVLVWVVWKLLRGEDAGGDRAGQEAGSFRQAILLVVVADCMMSLDNVIAVAGSAHGSVGLLAAGLLLSMPLLLVTGGFVSALVDRARWLLYLGAAAISFTAARMVFEDRAVVAWLNTSSQTVLCWSIAAGLAVPGACRVLNGMRADARPAREGDGPQP
jgi:YjbE family integral membrane protein